MIKPLLHEDPQHIDAYRLVARLGSGGMGTVYLARSPGGRMVALKTVHAHIAADTTFRTRFRLETDAARVIGGLHGAQVVDADPLAEMPWLATEYVLGPPLDDAVSLCGPLPEATVRAVGAALCGALGQLHGSDVVHRDLKPSNILITAYGPKVIDFGIARAIGDDRLTRVGAAAGTPAFMSPEQATDQEHTSAGDVFALAGVLVFAASGHGPFGSGQAADLLYRVRYADPGLTGVPTTLVPILTRCLAKDPSLRPTTQELAAELHDGHGEFADHLPAKVLTEIARLSAEVWQFRPERLPAVSPEQPVTGSEPSASGRGTGMSRRKVLSITGLATAGAAVASTGLWFQPGQSEARKSGPPTEAEATARPAARDAEGPWRVLWTNKSVSVDSGTPPLFVGDRVAVATSTGLSGLDPATGKERWWYPPERFDPSGPATSSEWISPSPVTDGTWLYCLAPDEKKRVSLITLDPATGLPHRTITTLPSIKASLVSAVAVLLAASGGTVYLAVEKTGSAKPRDWDLLAVNAASGRVRWRVPFSHDDSRIGFAKVIGNRLVTGRVTSDLVLSAHDTGSGTNLWTTTLPNWDYRVNTSPVTSGGQLADDGTHVYVATDVLRSISLSDATVIWEFGRDRIFGSRSAIGGHPYGAPAVRGGVVYAAEGDRGIVALDTKRGELLWEALAPEGNASIAVGPPVLSRTHLYYKDESGLGAIDLRTRKYVRSLKTPIWRFAFTADKTLIGTGDRTVEALRMD